MDYNQIKDAIQSISQQHIAVKKFDHGDNWETTVDGDGIDSYPKIYFETPILSSVDKTRKTMTFGLICFIYPSEVYVKENHFDSITKASEILDQIITKLSKDYSTKISVGFPYSTVTFIIDTTSMLDGVRADLSITTVHNCNVDDQFDVNKSFN